MSDEIFFGRHKELELLEKLYSSPRFEMLLLHGRRRVGKSFLLGHFASMHVFIPLTGHLKNQMYRLFLKNLKDVLKENSFCHPLRNEVMYILSLTLLKLRSAL